MIHPRYITSEAEIQNLLELRHEMHIVSMGEWVFELDNGGTLNVRAQADYLHAVYYPPGWVEQ